MEADRSLRTKRALDQGSSLSDNNGNNNSNNNNNNKVKLPKLEATTKKPVTNHTATTVLSLPLNIWLLILKKLPLRHVIPLACVSRDFYVHVFSMAEFWLYVQRKARCHQYVPSPDTPLVLCGLECRRLMIKLMNSICDYCYLGAIYSVEYDGYKAVLPVRISQDKKDSHSIRRRRYSVHLCGTCRILHFQQHPEPIYEDTRTTILSREEIATNYCVPKKDITYLWNKKGGHIDRRSDTYTRLFARCIYGGDVGIEAEKQREQHMVGNL